MQHDAGGRQRVPVPVLRHLTIDARRAVKQVDVRRRPLTRVGPDPRERAECRRTIISLHGVVGRRVPPGSRRSPPLASSGDAETNRDELHVRHKRRKRRAIGSWVRRVRRVGRPQGAIRRQRRAQGLSERRRSAGVAFGCDAVRPGHLHRRYRLGACRRDSPRLRQRSHRAGVFPSTSGDGWVVISMKRGTSTDPPGRTRAIGSRNLSVLSTQMAD